MFRKITAVWILLVLAVTALPAQDISSSPELSSTDRELTPAEDTSRKTTSLPLLPVFAGRGLYAALAAGHSFTLNPLLGAGNFLGMYLQWRQLPYLSLTLRFGSGLFSLQPSALAGHDAAAGYLFSISPESSAVFYQLSAGILFHLAPVNLPSLDMPEPGPISANQSDVKHSLKLTPEFGVSFLWNKINSGQFEFTDAFGASFHAGLSLEISPKFYMGLGLIFDLDFLAGIQTGGQSYSLDYPASALDLSISLLAGYKLF